MDIINNKLIDENGNEHYSPGNYIGSEIKPKYVIMHCTATASPFDRNVQAFLLPSYKASVHLLIGRSGEVHQFVPFNSAAAHCGENHWHDVNHSMDRYSIGIEMVNANRLKSNNQTDYYRINAGITYTIDKEDRVFINDHWWQIYPQAQVDAALAVVRLLFQHYPDLKDVLGHNEINPKYRSDDPGPVFPMQWFHGKVLGIDENLPVTRVHITTVFSRIYNAPGEGNVSIGDGYPRNTPLGVLKEKDGWSFVHVNPEALNSPIITGWIPSVRIAEDSLKPRHYHSPREIMVIM